MDPTLGRDRGDEKPSRHHHTPETLNTHAHAGAEHENSGTLRRRPKPERGQQLKQKGVADRMATGTGIDESLEAPIIDNLNTNESMPGLLALTTAHPLQIPGQGPPILTQYLQTPSQDPHAHTINVSIHNNNNTSGHRGRRSRSDSRSQSQSQSRSRVWSDDRSPSPVAVPATTTTFPAPRQWWLIRNQGRPRQGRLLSAVRRWLSLWTNLDLSRLARPLVSLLSWRRVLLITTAALCFLYIALPLASVTVTVTGPLCLCSCQCPPPPLPPSHPSRRPRPRPVLNISFNTARSVPSILVPLRSSLSGYIDGLEFSCGCVVAYTTPDYLKRMCSWSCGSDQEWGYRSLTSAIDSLSVRLQEHHLLKGPGSIASILADISVAHSSAHELSPPESPSEPPHSCLELRTSSRFHMLLLSQWCALCCSVLPRIIATVPPETKHSHAYMQRHATAVSVIEACRTAVIWRRDRLKVIRAELRSLSTTVGREPACRVHKQLAQDLASREQSAAFGGGASPSHVLLQGLEDLAAIFSLPCVAWKGLAQLLRQTLNETQSDLAKVDGWLKELAAVDEGIINYEGMMGQDELDDVLERLVALLESLTALNDKYSTRE